MTTLLIGGDVCPINRNAPLFADGDPAAIFGDLLPEFQRADLALVNLECPLVEQLSPIEKVGPVLSGDRRAAKTLARAGVHLANLANNHILDHGPDGLMSTIAALDQAGVATLGAGANLSEAGRKVIHEVNGVRVALFAYAEQEFSVAGQQSAGANPLSLTDFVRSVRLYRDSFDFLLVLLHAGVQHFPFPTPKLRELCRFMVEEGAGAVICQHSHCAGCFEEYQGGQIVYGQGNLIFDRYPDRADSFHTGYLVRLSLSGDLSCRMELIPYRQSDAIPGARRMTGEEARAFMESLAAMNRELADPSALERRWSELCLKKKHDFFSILKGHGRLLRYLNRKVHLSDLFYSRRQIANLRNIVTCESHKEMLERILTL